MTKVWKLHHSLFLRFPTAFSQNTSLLRKWLSFVPRAPEIITSKFSGVLNTMVGNQAEILWIPLNQTWQTNLLWPIIPPVPEQRWLAYHYTKLGRWTQFGQWTLPVAEQKWPAYHYTKRGRLTYFAWTQWQRFESSSIYHFWDTPQHFLKTHFCLESGFHLFLELQKPLLVSFKGCWTQWQRFESSSIYCFWDTPLHFLKTCFSLEIGFLLFLELQKSLLVCFQGCWTQWQRFESSSIHHFWDTPLCFWKHVLT